MQGVNRSNWSNIAFSFVCLFHWRSWYCIERFKVWPCCKQTAHVILSWFLALCWRHWAYVAPFRSMLSPSYSDSCSYTANVVAMLGLCWDYVRPIFGSLADFTTFLQTDWKAGPRANMPPGQAKTYNACNCFWSTRAHKKSLSAPLVRADFPEKCGYSLPYHFPGLSMGTFHFSLTESTVANQPAGCSGGHNGHSAHNGDAHDPNCTGDVPGHSIYHSGYIVSLETYIFKYHMGIGIGGGKVSMDLRDHDIIIQWDIMGYNI